MKKLSAEYITGLVDGEGSFTFYIRNPEDNFYRIRRVKAEPRFYLKLIEKDKKILYKLKDYFSCGNVYFQKDKRLNHQNCYRYEVANRKHLEEIIIPFFKKNGLKLQSKQNDFEIFCKLMEMIKSGNHLTKNGLQKMYRIKAKMH